MTSHLISSNQVGHKWNPGHYMLTWWGDDPFSKYNKMLNEPNFLGCKERFLWRFLEPTKDNYDFSLIEQNLEYLRSYGKRLVISPYYMYARTPYPDYIADNPGTYGEIVAVENSTSTLPRIWTAPVMDRLIALYEALADRFDNELYIEAISTQETSIPLSPEQKADPAINYTNEEYVTQLKRLVTAATAAWQHTIFEHKVNFMAGNSLTVMQDFVSHIYNAGGGCGGPDAIPDSISTGQDVSKDYFGMMPLAVDVQSPELGGHEGYYLPEDIYQFAINTLKVDHMYWIEQGTEKGDDYSFVYGIVPTVNSHDGAINTGFPTNIAPQLTVVNEIVAGSEIKFKGLKLIADNVADSGSLQSDPVMLTTLPIDNLQNSSWSEPAKTSSTADVSIYLTWDGLEHIVDGIALTGHNLTGNAIIRFQFFEWSSWTGSTVYDSGYIVAVAEEVIGNALGYHDTTVFLPTPVTSRSVKIDISDSGNPHGYFQFHRLFFGRALQLDSSAAYGLTLGVTDTTEHFRSHAGTLYSKTGSTSRFCSFAMENGPDSDTEEWMTGLLTCAKKRDVYFSVFPANEYPEIEHAHHFAARLDDSATFTANEPNNQIIALSLIEA